MILDWRRQGMRSFACTIAVAALTLACGEPDPVEGRAVEVHPDGWQQGHARALESSGYAFDGCLGCHGEPGDAVACAECHADGPDACETCHGEETGRHGRGGGHPAHAKLECATCHKVPESLTDEGHVADLGDQDVTVTGSYAEGRCSDTTCHAGPGAAVPAPVWGGRLGGCDACHGVPPPPHPVGDCANCHPGVDGGTHVNGEIDLAIPDDCGACHAERPETGAHLAHRSGRIAPVVECTECHVVPAEPRAEGHLDPPPVDVTVASGGTYTEGRCSDTTCHGPDRPAWTGTAPCGSCHGIPPAAPHPTGDCARCHLGAAPGLEIASPELHLNGTVEVGGEECARCHGEGALVTPGRSHPAHARFECPRVAT